MTKKLSELLRGMGSRFDEKADQLMSPAERAQFKEEDFKQSLHNLSLNEAQEKARQDLSRDLTVEEVQIVHEDNIKHGDLEGYGATSAFLGIRLKDADILRIVDTLVYRARYKDAIEAAQILPEPKRSKSVQAAYEECARRGNLPDFLICASRVGRTPSVQELSRFRKEAVGSCYGLTYLDQVAELMKSPVLPGELMAMFEKALELDNPRRAMEIEPRLPEAERPKAQDRIAAVLAEKGEINQLRTFLSSVGRPLTTNLITATIVGQCKHQKKDALLRTALLIPDAERVEVLTNLLATVKETKDAWRLGTPIADLVLQFVDV